MGQSFFEYTKITLERINFDKWLTLKEYLKALPQLSQQERGFPDNWLNDQWKGNRPFLSSDSCK